MRREGLESLLSSDDEDGVVDVHSNHESSRQAGRQVREFHRFSVERVERGGKREGGKVRARAYLFGEREEGADHVPSGSLATTIPAPPVVESQE